MFCNTTINADCFICEILLFHNYLNALPYIFPVFLWYGLSSKWHCSSDLSSVCSQNLQSGQWWPSLLSISSILDLQTCPLLLAFFPPVVPANLLWLPCTLRAAGRQQCECVLLLPGGRTAQNPSWDGFKKKVIYYILLYFLLLECGWWTQVLCAAASSWRSDAGEVQ